MIPIPTAKALRLNVFSPCVVGNSFVWSRRYESNSSPYPLTSLNDFAPSSERNLFHDQLPGHPYKIGIAKCHEPEGSRL